MQQFNTTNVVLNSIRLATPCLTKGKDPVKEKQEKYPIVKAPVFW